MLGRFNCTAIVSVEEELQMQVRCAMSDRSWQCPVTLNNASALEQRNNLGAAVVV